MSGLGKNQWILPKGGSSIAGTCFRCGKPVKIEKAAVMEEDKNACHYHDLGVPEESISSVLVVGSDCAKTLRRLAVEEGVPNTPERQQEVWDRVSARTAVERKQTQELQQGDSMFFRKEATLAYCDFIDQVLVEQRKQAEKKGQPGKV